MKTLAKSIPSVQTKLVSIVALLVLLAIGNQVSAQTDSKKLPREVEIARNHKYDPTYTHEKSLVPTRKFIVKGGGIYAISEPEVMHPERGITKPRRLKDQDTYKYEK